MIGVEVGLGSRRYGAFLTGLISVRKILKIAVMVFFWAGFSGGGLDAQALVIITEHSPPVNYVESGKITGSSTEVVREILRRLHQPDSIRLMPWARGYRLALTKPDVALFSCTRMPERENLFKWVGPLCVIRWGFYARKDSTIRIDSIEDAKKVAGIATYKDDAKEQFLKAQGFTNLDSSNSPQSGLRKLLEGRVQLWLYDNLGMPSIANEIGKSPNDIKLVYPLRRFELYIAFSKGTPDKIVRAWQQTLDAMKQDGTFHRICSRWLPPECIPGGVAKQPDDGISLVIYTENNPPSSFLKDREVCGFSVDLVQEILRRLKYNTAIHLVPWARGYTMALTRPNIALFATTRLPSRENLFKWVGPIYKQHWGFYSKKGSRFHISCLEDAKHVARIGTYHSDAKEQFLKSQGFTNLVSANNNISNVKRLMEGKIDLWVSSDFNTAHIARQAGVDPAMLELVYTFHAVENYIAFSRQMDDNVVKRWQETLDMIKRDGTYDAMYRKWIHP